MRRIGVAGLVFSALATVAIPSVASPTAQPTPASPAADHSGRTGNLIVMVRSPRIVAPTRATRREALLDSAQGRIEAVLDRTALTRVRSIPELGAVAVRPVAGQALAGARRELEADPAVMEVELERYRTLRYLPDDPAVTRHDNRAPSNDFYQWNLREERFPKAWKRTRGRRAKLAVIDTGIDGGHFDLSRRVVYAKGYDDAECGGGAQPACTGPRHDEVGHGTHVAGLACGTGNNGDGVAGAAFKCKLINEKASNTVNLDDSLIARSITNATNHGADVISMSFGGPGRSGVINRALDYAYKRDVVLVAAASNNNTTHQGTPASHLQPNGTGDRLRSGKGLVVTAAGHNDRRAWFQPGRGTGISLAAYGSASAACAIRSDCGIFSTFPGNPTAIETGDPANDEPPCGNCRASFHGSNDFAYLEGTSMATPQVAGAAALIRSKRPGIDNDEVLLIIKRTASGHRFRNALGWGILNAGRALKRAAR
jgi:subtilisin family serine protease